jgi:hypothetical protein
MAPSSSRFPRFLHESPVRLSQSRKCRVRYVPQLWHLFSLSQRPDRVTSSQQLAVLFQEQERRFWHEIATLNASRFATSPDDELILDSESETVNPDYSVTPSNFLWNNCSLHMFSLPWELSVISFLALLCLYGVELTLVGQLDN